MLDAADVDASSLELFPVERRSPGRDAKSPFEPRSPHRLKPDVGYVAEQSDGPLGIRAQSEALGQLDDLREGVHTRPGAQRLISCSRSSTARSISGSVMSKQGARVNTFL